MALKERPRIHALRSIGPQESSAAHHSAAQAPLRACAAPPQVQRLPPSRPRRHRAGFLELAESRPDRRELRNRRPFLDLSSRSRHGTLLPSRADHPPRAITDRGTSDDRRGHRQLRHSRHRAPRAPRCRRPPGPASDAYHPPIESTRNFITGGFEARRHNCSEWRV